MSGDNYSERKKALREKYAQYGFEALSEAEITELLLSYSSGKGFISLSEKLNTAFSSATAVADADRSYLENNFKLDEKSTVLLKLLPQLSRLYFLKNEKTAVLSSSDAAKKYFEGFFIGAVNEQLAVLCTTDKFRVISSKIISYGTSASVSVILRDIADFALKFKSEKLFVAHNHPIGSAAPSTSDINTTDMLCRRLEKLGITLIDHIIISKSSAFSMRELPYTVPFRNSDPCGYLFTPLSY